MCGFVAMLQSYEKLNFHFELNSFPKLLRICSLKNVFTSDKKYSFAQQFLKMFSGKWGKAMYSL